MGTKACADCGHRATARARFCEQCGAALTPSAKPLRAPSTLESRILSERAGIEGERKQVTVMVTDIVGSMELTRTLDAERWGLVLDRFLGIAAAAVHAFEGTVSHFTGDGLLAVFGAPLAHEDHARRACLAVLELQRDVATLDAELTRSDGVEFAVRCGLNSGEVIVGSIGDDVHMDFVPIGNTTALAKRMEALAPVRSTAISASTAALVDGEFELRELGQFEVEGVSARQRVLELVRRGPAQSRLAAVATTRGLTRFIGRDAELARLESALEHALNGHGRALGIVGDPGVGKSRLVHEFVAGCTTRGVTVTSASCVPHGLHVPLLPILALYRGLFGIDERDAPDLARRQIESTLLAHDPDLAADLPLLCEFLGVSDDERPLALLDPAAGRQRLLDVMRRTVATRSRHEAVVLVVEDLHWIDDASAAFVEALVKAVVGTRTVMVTTYRPEYEADWVRRPPHAELRLDPLDGEAAGDLLSELLGPDRSLDGLSALIEERTGGNPFFIEEIVQALAESGHLSGAPGRYRLATELDGLVLPPTVQAGLAARIDRLPAREKALVQAMSVIGNEVPGRLLGEVCDLGAGELTDAVGVLATAQMVVPRDSSDGHVYVFKHPLTQEVAYGSQLSQGRMRAHLTVAAAIERTYPYGLDERAALLAHHCEVSGEGLKAAGWHARAAAWAHARSPAESMRHWRRVGELTSELDASPERDELAARARIGILGAGWRVGMAPEETAALHAEADVERSRLERHQASVLLHSGRELEALDWFRRATQEAIEAGDRGLGLTLSLATTYGCWIAGSLRETVEGIERALRLAGGDPKIGAGLTFVCPLAHAFAQRGQAFGYMGALDRARRDYDRGLELARAQDDPESESYCHSDLALIEAEVGEVDAAVGHAALAIGIAKQTDSALCVVLASTAGAVAEAAAGRFADARTQARSVLATIRQQGFAVYNEPLLLATIARSELALGQPDEALAAAEEAVAIMNARSLTTCALPAPIALAQVLIAGVGAAAAERIDAVLARAMHVARDSGARIYEPQIHRELAEVARLCGDEVAAERSEAEATRLVAAMRSEPIGGGARSIPVARTSTRQARAG